MQTVSAGLVKDVRTNRSLGFAKHLGCLTVTLLTVWAIPHPCLGQPGIISTVAGNGTAGLGFPLQPPPGDGGLATSAPLLGPGAIAVDDSGNIYFVDQARVRKVDILGTIHTVAGNGLMNFSGDGGPATGAGIGFCGSGGMSGGIAVDNAGNTYIADCLDSRIRKVDTGGIITTIAGTGSSGVFGFSGDNGPAISAQLNAPRGIALDSGGNLFIADSGNLRVRKVSLKSGIITTVAGNGQVRTNNDDGQLAINAAIDAPFNVAVDSQGNLYIASGSALREVSTAGVISTVTGAAGATNSLAVDTAGNLYFGESFALRELNTGGALTTIAGGGNK
jgi:sugar lactone lactonase YvrE